MGHGVLLSSVKGAVKGGAKKAAGVGRAIKKGAKIGAAAAKLGVIVNDPLNQAKFLKGAVTKGEFIFPGSKYIGPGNAMNKGAPTSRADANAYEHDVAYGKYLEKGHKAKDVYLGYSDADERLLRKTKADTPEGLVVNLGMLAKKGLNKTGLTKRIRDNDPKVGGMTSSDMYGSGRQKQ